MPVIGDYLVVGIPFSRHVFWFYMFYPPVLQAVELTLILSVVSQGVGIVLGTLTALGRMSTIRTGPRFLFVGFGCWVLAAAVHPVLGGELDAWCTVHALEPPGGAETWLAGLLALTGAGIIALGVTGRLAGGRIPWLQPIAAPSWAPFQAVTGAYIWLFRGTPLLVQLAFVFFVIPDLTNYQLTWTGFFSPVWAAAIGLSLNEGAYMAEIVRAGISSVPSGQMEAAQSLGMTRSMAMRRVILPQATRIIIPPTGNEYISMLKNSSLAYSIGVIETWGQVRLVFTGFGGLGGGRYFELIAVAAVWYLILTTAFSLVQVRIERHFSRGFTREIRQPGTFQRLMVGSLRRA